MVVEGKFTSPPFQLSLETLRVVSLPLCHIQKPLIRNTHAKFGNPNLLQSSDIVQNADRGLFNWSIYGQISYKQKSSYSRTSENIYGKLGQLSKQKSSYSRTSDNIYGKLGRLSKHEQINRMISKKFDDDVMSTNYEIITNFSIQGRFGTIWKPNF